MVGLEILIILLHQTTFIEVLYHFQLLFAAFGKRCPIFMLVKLRQLSWRYLPTFICSIVVFLVFLFLLTLIHQDCFT